ncbi:MAG: hypothetical protein LUD72_02235 [Bacteroidales bacterium]|nr:hypothetical protein [Bacteroidales bacterium]
MKGSKLTYALTALGDMFLPRTCIICGTRLSADEEFICPDCSDDLPLTYYWDIPFNPAADRLNESIQHKFDVLPETAVPHPDSTSQSADSTGKAEDETRPEYEPYARYAGLFFYNSDNNYRLICQRLKYDGDLALGRHYSHLLGEKLVGSELFRDVDLVVPVPLHWTRQWKRGYNQSAVISAEVAAVLGAVHKPRLLIRKRRTQTQTVLSVEEKKLNVAGAFTVNRRSLPPQTPHHILLIDDMLTTGATIAACHAALRTVFPTSVRISAATLGCFQSK